MGANARLSLPRSASNARTARVKSSTTCSVRRGTACPSPTRRIKSTSVSNQRPSWSASSISNSMPRTSKRRPSPGAWCHRSSRSRKTNSARLGFACISSRWPAALESFSVRSFRPADHRTTGCRLPGTTVKVTPPSSCVPSVRTAGAPWFRYAGPEIGLARTRTVNSTGPVRGRASASVGRGAATNRRNRHAA